ncbi:hypothetical protein Enr13x_53130 [Stieleria neptunia]|uniref:Uncharacterized protein n=1 Tax=Stieleria neptunia TaxID=2527979 RepID=A0A518HXF7_9BACT|nr:hypothetical protein [Stieleria neptunia]QDV45434.1 hypothetical protein Enr13x_53130 [Stieleria neptunia]
MNSKCFQIAVLSLCGVAVICAVLLGRWSDPLVDFLAPDALTVYSIDYRDAAPGDSDGGTERFHGFAILGKVEILDVERRNAILSSLRNGIHNGDGRMKKCFFPRHAIRAIQDENSVECLVCFECGQMKIWSTGPSISTLPVILEQTSSDPQKVFDETLRSAGIPIARYLAME